MALNVPKRPSGYLLGDGNAPVQMEVFLDIQCPFSKKAWPTLMAICDAYPAGEVAIRAQFMALANHGQAWTMTRLLHAICGQDPDKFRDFAGFLYANQERFYNGPFADQTPNNLLKFAVTLAHEWNASEADVAARLNSDEVSEQTRIPIRHAARRGVWSTPTFVVNGVEATNMGSANTIDEWKSALDELLASA